MLYGGPNLENSRWEGHPRKTVPDCSEDENLTERDHSTDPWLGKSNTTLRQILYLKKISLSINTPTKDADKSLLVI